MMLALMLLSAFVQDDRAEERARMELLARLKSAVASVRPADRPVTTSASVDLYQRAVATQSLRSLSDPVYSGPATTWGRLVQDVAESRTGTLHVGSRTRESTGPVLGVFLDDAGTLLTAEAAIAGSREEPTVVLPDGRTAKARVVTSDPTVGLAILKVEFKSTAIPHGDAAPLIAGRTVIVATRAGDDPAIRRAAVLGRPGSLESLASAEDFFHLDYAALPHELGAAVLDLDGKFVGLIVRTAYESAGGGGEIPRRAYAVPIGTIRAFLAKRDDQGRFEPGYIGVRVESEKDGLRVIEVVPGSGADRGGLKHGDVILSVDGRTVSAVGDLTRIVRFKAREKVRIVVARDRKEETLELEVGVLEADRPKATPQQVLLDRVGLEVVDLTEELRKWLEMPDQEGVVIQRVVEGSVAAQAGLRKGAVITRVDNSPVGKADAFREKVRELPRDTYLVLEVWQDGKRMPVVLKVR